MFYISEKCVLDEIIGMIWGRGADRPGATI